jgi:DNA repair protein RecO (recombination protein O)
MEKTVTDRKEEKKVPQERVELTGIVLSAMPIGEYDKRVVILTKERGRIHAFARGARRMNSALLAPSNPFTFGKFEVYEGRNAYTLYRVSAENYFRELTADLDTMYYGFYFLEVAEHFTQENMEATQQLKLLYQSLRALTHPQLNARLVRCIYEWKSCVIAGVCPNIYSCQRCQTTKQLSYFYAPEHGVFCPSCRPKASIRLEDSMLYTLQYITSSSIEKLYTFTVSEDVLCNFERITKDVMHQYTDRKFRSLEFIV